jgi:hypothetical protein
MSTDTMERELRLDLRLDGSCGFVVWDDEENLRRAVFTVDRGTATVGQGNWGMLSISDFMVAGQFLVREGLAKRWDILCDETVEEYGEYDG